MTPHEGEIAIDVDGERIAATRISPASALPGVLLVHGWGGSQDQYLGRAREIAALGCICLTFDLRGHARTERQRETVTREDNLRDVLAAYDRLASMPEIDAGSIAVIGSSYGGYLAAILTRLRAVRWLGLRAPALYKDDNWDLPKRRLHEEQRLAEYRRRRVKAPDNRALSACAEYTGDVLLVESERDTVIPHPVIASYVAACARARSMTHRVITGADHALSDAASRKAYTTLLVNWLNEMIAGARAGGTAPQGDARRDPQLHDAAAG
jgi:dienelactone hydrolase